jgi:hypothetical protein
MPTTANSLYGRNIEFRLHVVARPGGSGDDHRDERVLRGGDTLRGDLLLNAFFGESGIGVRSAACMAAICSSPAFRYRPACIRVKRGR